MWVGVQYSGSSRFWEVGGGIHCCLDCNGAVNLTMDAFLLEGPGGADKVSFRFYDRYYFIFIIFICSVLFLTLWHTLRVIINKMDHHCNHFYNYYWCHSNLFGLQLLFLENCKFPLAHRECSGTLYRLWLASTHMPFFLALNFPLLI